jgi:uncharacterized LabA/DUF88 family protein/cold shock CspA family protein
MIRIGVFYDGNYFLHVSNFYNYVHERRSRFSIAGLHEFIRHHVAEECRSEVRLCQIVDAHFFRGRLNAREASQKENQLYYDRVFDDILMLEGVTTHYLPVRSYNGQRVEKGIDVWLALEAFELTIHKSFDVVVLIGSDGDYVPLVRKLNTLGTKVMVLGWDFEFTDENENKHTTKTSVDLLNEVTYPVPMHDVIEKKLRTNDPIINKLFVPKTGEKLFNKQSNIKFDQPLVIDKTEKEPNGNIELNGNSEVNGNIDLKTSYIMSIKDGYGFIKFPPDNAFFHYKSLVEYDFNDLEVGDTVEFKLEQNELGKLVAKEIRVVE